MKTIYKYAIEVKSGFELDLPRDAQVLTVQVQNEDPQVWVLLDTSEPTVKRKFRIYGTGHEINPKLKLTYSGSFQLYSGNLVFHVFEET